MIEMFLQNYNILAKSYLWRKLQFSSRLILTAPCILCVASGYTNMSNTEIILVGEVRVVNLGG